MTKNSVCLHQEKRSEIRNAQRHCGLTQYTWARRAYVSEPTIKRFLGGIPIKAENFMSICKVIDIENWQEFVNWNDIDSTAVLSKDKKSQAKDLKQLLEYNGELKNEVTKASFVVSGNFTKKNEIPVKTITKQLKNIVLNLDVDIEPNGEDQNFLLINADFNKDKLIRVKVLIDLLGSFILESKIIIDLNNSKD